MRPLRSKPPTARKQIAGWLFIAAVYVLPFFAIPATATLYLKVEGFKGPVTTPGFEEWIDAHSFRFGLNRASGSKGPSPASVSEVLITKGTDATTPLLFSEAVAGREKVVELELVRTGTRGAERYYKLKLYDVLVSAFSQSSGGDGIPQESVSLNYLKMEMTFTEFVDGQANDATTAWYDVETGKGGITSPPNNTPPTISALPSTNTLEDVALTIPFTVGDTETSADNLSLSRTTSNPGLLPLANITFSGSGANRNVRLLPATNQTGSATVTITVSDGSLSASRTFTLTVTPVNDAPIVSAIQNQSTAQDTPITVGFTLNDPDHPADSLQLVAASSNTALVPNANLVFGGSGTARTLTMTPASGQTGQTTISIRASDGLLETTNSFLLTVSFQPSNQPPSFTVSDASVIPTIAGRPTAISRLQVSDPDAGTNPVALALQVVNGTITISNWAGGITSNGAANVFLSGSIPQLNTLLGSSNGVVYRPNAGTSGTDLFTATVNDNGHTGAGEPQSVYTTLGIRIYASQYDEWLHQQFTQSELTNSALEATLWGFHADSDNDRLENVAEYGQGTAPRDTNHPRPTAEFVEQSGERRLALQINRRKDPDLTLTVEVAGNITGPWSSDAAQLESIPPVDLGNGFEQVRFIDRAAATTTERRFMRMRWTLTPPFAAAPAGKSTRR